MLFAEVYAVRTGDEALFKALARALREAVEVDPRAANQVPSTKGTLDA